MKWGRKVEVGELGEEIIMKGRGRESFDKKWDMINRVYCYLLYKKDFGSWVISRFRVCRGVWVLSWIKSIFILLYVVS